MSRKLDARAVAFEVMFTDNTYKPVNIEAVSVYIEVISIKRDSFAVFLDVMLLYTT
jgi:hypothetical protein